MPNADRLVRECIGYIWSRLPDIADFYCGRDPGFDEIAKDIRFCLKRHFVENKLPLDRYEEISKIVIEYFAK